MCLRRSDFFDLIRDSNKSLIANQTKRHLYAEPSSKSFTFTIAAAIGNIIKSRQFNDVLSPPDDKPKSALRPVAVTANKMLSTHQIPSYSMAVM